MPKPKPEAETEEAETTEEEELDATEAEWQEGEEDPTVGEQIVPYEGGIVPRAQWDLAAVFEGFRGVALWTHDNKPALYYDIQNRGRGLTVRAMRILSAMRGGFEEVDLKVAPGQCFEALIGPDGKPVIEAIPAVEATVRIRDLVAGNVRIGHWSEPVAKLRSDKRGYYVVPNPAMVAEAKAKRNAYAEHFSPIIEPLLKAIMEECAKKQVFFSGTVPGWAVLPESAEGDGLPSAATNRRQRAEAVMGIAGRDQIASRLRDLEASAGRSFTEEFVTWGSETFGTSVIVRWPARRKQEVDEWFKEREDALAQAAEEAVDGDRVAADEERPDPHEEPPQAPTELDVRGLLKAMMKEQVAEAYKRAGMRPTQPFDSPERAAKLYNALVEVREEA